MHTELIEELVYMFCQMGYFKVNNPDTQYTSPASFCHMVSLLYHELNLYSIKNSRWKFRAFSFNGTQCKFIELGKCIRGHTGASRFLKHLQKVTDVISLLCR